MIGIPAGARSSTQVTSPGAASNRRAPNWRRASSKADVVRTLGAGAEAILTRLWPRQASGIPIRNTGRPPRLVVDMENMKHFDGPTFEADVLQSSQPVVVAFSTESCGPCRMMSPLAEQLASEYARQVPRGKLDGDVKQEIAL